MSVRPFLRWAGSKRKQLPHLSQFWNCDFRRYVEPFAGSACLFFSLQPKKALLADKNAELIDCYEVVRNRPHEVYSKLQRINRSHTQYYRLRQTRPNELADVDRAVRFLFLNRNCFNGIYRTNLKGEFNVPFSASRTGEFVTLEEFTTAAQLLKVAELHSWDYLRTLQSVRKGDFVYMDPPFAVSSRRVFKEYGAKTFNLADLEILRTYLPLLHRQDVSFVLSYAYCQQSQIIAKEWRALRIRVRRHIAGFATKRRVAYEHIITNIE